MAKNLFVEEENEPSSEDRLDKMEMMIEKIYQKVCGSDETKEAPKKGLLIVAEPKE